MTLNSDTRIWIRRTKALSLAEIGKNDLALKEFFYILRYKSDWFVLFEISHILLEIKQIEASVYFATRALLDSQNPKYKIKLYNFFVNNGSDIFDEVMIKQLIQKVYTENNMRMPAQIVEICKNIDNIDLSAIELDKKIKNIATMKLYKNKYEGIVTRIFNKFSGLLKTDKKTLFYTKKDNNIELAEKSKVKYVITWNFDAKRMQVRKSALVLSII